MQIVRAIQEKGGRFLEFIISEQSMMNNSEGIINERRGGKWYAIGDSQAVLRTARELSNRNNNPNLFDQNRRMAVAQEQRQREDQLLLLQRQQQQQQQQHHENFVTARKQQQNHGHFVNAGNNTVATSMCYGVVENDRDRAKAAKIIAAAFGSETDEERTALRTKENLMEMERIMILRDEQQQDHQQQQQQQQQAQLQQQHQQLQQQLQLQQQQQQLLQRQQQAQVLARAMGERQMQRQLEQQVHVQSQSQVNTLQQQSTGVASTTAAAAPIIYKGPRIIPKLADVLWARGLSQHPGNLTYRKMVLASMQDQSVLNWNETKLNAVSRSIVTTIKVEYSGRFLQNMNLLSAENDDDDDDEVEVAAQNKYNMVWCEISTEKAFEKTLCALREAREKLLRHVAVKEQEQNSVARLPDAVESPGETDVVFGATPGTEALKHPGNQVYRSLVSCNTGRYRSCESEVKRRRICKSVVAAIKGQDGRFLKLNRATGLWQVIPDSKTIELTSAILQRVDKNTTTKKIVGNPRLQQKQQGTKSKPIDIIDVDEDNTEINPPAIKPPTVKNPIKRDTTSISNNRKKFCTSTMVQELYKLQEKKAPGVNVTASEYTEIEKVAKKKFGLGENVYMSKKLVQNMASEMRRAARKVEVINREETAKEEEEVEVEEDYDDAESDSDGSLVF
jgi:hypothetical protein